MKNLDINEWLSETGKRLHYPSLGIVKQAADASEKRINATAGVAFDDEGYLLTLPSLQKHFGNNTNLLNYADTNGLKELRLEWLKGILKKNPSIGDTQTTLPTVTNGITHGIKIAGKLFLDAGENLILPDMFWDNYRLIFEMGLRAGLKTFPTFYGENFNIEALRKLALEGEVRKRVFMFNVPNNPTGYSPTHAEYKEIVDIMIESAEAGNKVVALCDDAYFGLFYGEEVAKESLFSALSNAHKNIITVKLDGATKEEFAWGLRLGFITIAGKGLSKEDRDLLENKIAGAIRSDTSNGCRPSQEALLNLLKNPNHYAEKKACEDILRERFIFANDWINKNKERYESYFKLLPCNSGYFFCLELSRDINGEQLRQTLLKDHDMGIIVLGNLLRLAFSAVNKKQLEELLETIYLCCKKQS